MVNRVSGRSEGVTDSLAIIAGRLSPRVWLARASLPVRLRDTQRHMEAGSSHESGADT